MNGTTIPLDIAVSDFLIGQSFLWNQHNQSQRLRAAMKSGTLTSTALVEQCLARIKAGDGELGAWVSVDVGGARRTLSELIKS